MKSVSMPLKLRNFILSFSTYRGKHYLGLLLFTRCTHGKRNDCEMIATHQEQIPASMPETLIIYIFDLA